MIDQRLKKLLVEAARAGLPNPEMDLVFQTRKTMSFEQAYYITQIIAGTGFILSIVFLTVQMRRSSYT